MQENEIQESMKPYLKRPEKRNDVRITTYLEAELYDTIMILKRSGISIKKVINQAVADLLKKHGLI